MPPVVPPFGMDGEQAGWAAAVAQARRFVSGQPEIVSSSRDDVVQDACLQAWRWRGKLRDPGRLAAAVCTIVRRQRYRAIAEVRRRRWLSYVAFGEADVREPIAPADQEPSLVIAGEVVSMAWAARRLPIALAELGALDRKLLLGLHEGFCCAELAERFGLSEACVKTRIHRARRRVRKLFERLVREGDVLGDHVMEERR